MCVYSVQVAALGRADPPYMESYRLSTKLGNWSETAFHKCSMFQRNYIIKLTKIVELLIM
jgi:hypothetical protein